MSEWGSLWSEAAPSFGFGEIVDRRRAHEKRELDAGFTRVTLKVANEDVEAVKAYVRKLRERHRSASGLGKKGGKAKGGLGKDE